MRPFLSGASLLSFYITLNPISQLTDSSPFLCGHAPFSQSQGQLLWPLGCLESYLLSGMLVGVIFGVFAWDSSQE